MAIHLAKGAFPRGMSELPAEVAEAIDQLPDNFGQQTFAANANLDFKKMKNPAGAWRLRVGDWRALFFASDKEFIVAAVGLRKDVYERAERMRLARKGAGLKIIETRARVQAPARPQALVPVSRPARRQRTIHQNPLSPFEDGMLLAVEGVDLDLLDFLRSLPPSVDIGDVLSAELDDIDVAFLLADMWERPNHHLSCFSDGSVPSVEDLAVEEAELALRLSTPDSETEVIAAETAGTISRVLDGSIEEWMIYLHPDQRSVAHMDFQGPSRVRGGPGTGKTVVALHRARVLARKRIDDGDKVLLTTFLSTLPKIWESLMRVLDPVALERMEVTSLDRLVLGIVRTAKGPVEILDPSQRQKLVDPLLQKHGLADRLGGNSQLLLDEFDGFIAGRGIEDLDSYLALQRRGGGSRLGKNDREKVFAAFSEYRERLERKGQYDWPLLRLEALSLAQSGEGPRFNGVIVDEAQDLSAVGMKFLLALDTSENHKHLTIIGDGQQAIYPGGFSLRELEIDIVGRSRVLTANWRNTWSVWVAAKAVIEGQDFDDLDDDVGLRPTGEEPEPLRLGDAAELHAANSTAEETELLAALVQERIAAGVDPGDIAVLCAVKKKGDAAAKALRELGIPTQPLAQYEGAHSDGVLIGTFNRAKGLEFKEVFIPGLAEGEWPSSWFVPKDLDPEQLEERMGLQLRTLFVAMTRGRDRLSLLCGGKPCEWVDAASWAMDRHEY